MHLFFIETPVFTERVVRQSLEDAVRKLQELLDAHPESGALDPGTGGMRKIRIASAFRGKGKRSGARVLYLFLPAQQVIYLVFVYEKNEGDTLSVAGKRTMRAFADAIHREWER